MNPLGLLLFRSAEVKVKVLKKKYIKEEKRHDEQYEKENKRHEKKHKVELEEALKIGKKPCKK